MTPVTNLLALSIPQKQRKMTSSAAISTMIQFGDLIRLRAGREAVVLNSIGVSRWAGNINVRVLGSCGVEFATILPEDVVAILHPTFTEFVNYYNVA